jgi:hypothetical protein
VATSERLAASADATARWVGKDALPGTQKRLRKQASYGEASKN